MKLYLLTAATAIALGFVMPVNAQEAVITEVAATADPEMPVANATLSAAWEAICNSDAKLSEKAQLSCLNGQMPKVAKSGDTFRNTGIGVEFNTLIRNAAVFATLPVEAATVQD